MKKIIFTAIILPITYLSFAQESKVIDILTGIEHAVINKEIGKALSYFDVTEEAFYTTHKRYLENLTKRDSLDYNLELHSLTSEKNNIKTIVLETISYWKYGRPKTEIGYKTYEFSLSKNQWTIHAVEERVYLKGKYANIEANFEPSKKSMSATAEIDFDIVEGGEKTILFWLNRGLKINKIENKSGKNISFVRKDLAVIIPWNKILKKGESLFLRIHFSGSFYNEFKELGYGLVNIGEEGVFGSWGTDWYPKLNGTLTKAKAILQYTVPSDLIVASVGRLEEKTEQNGKATYTYRVNTPMDYTFNANRFIHHSNDVNGVQVNVYLLNGTLEKAKMYADKSKEMIEYLTELYGVFPCDSYGISEVPMEAVLGLGGSGGQGLNFYPTNTLRDDTFEFPLIAHEVGHIWWGGLVKTDLIAGKLLDEGMAQVNAFLSYRHFYGEEAMWDFLNNGSDMFTKSAKFYFRQFNNNNDFPIGVYNEERENDYAVISYLKPHFVMAMLMETVGYPVFIRGIKRIISEYSTGKRLDLDGIKNIMEQESNLNLEYFFTQWFYQAGAPEFKMDYNVQVLEDKRYRIDVEIDQLREVFKVEAEIMFSNDLNVITKKIGIDENKEFFSFIIDFEPKSIIFDPHHKILRWSEKVNNLYLLSTGMREYFSGNKENGLEQLNQYVNYYPFDPTGRVILGELFLNEKKYGLARKHLQFVIDEYEAQRKMTFEVPLAYALMGSLYESEGNFELANEHFSKVLSMVNIEGSHAMAKKYFSNRNGNK